jgi:hypothetical protein
MKGSKPATVKRKAAPQEKAELPRAPWSIFGVVRGRIIAASSIVVTVASLVGAVYAVDGFYVRTSRYDADRNQSTRQSIAYALQQEIATLETREAFTRYRLRDAQHAKTPDDAALAEYRDDLAQLARSIQGKRRLLDELRVK